MRRECRTSSIDPPVWITLTVVFPSHRCKSSVGAIVARKELRYRSAGDVAVKKGDTLVTKANAKIAKDLCAAIEGCCKAMVNLVITGGA